MNANQIELIQSTFARLTCGAEREHVARLFSRLLCEIEPEWGTAVRTKAGALGRSVFGRLALIVGSLDQANEGAKPAPPVAEAQFAVNASEVDSAWLALLWTIAECLGDGFTHEMREAWRDCYRFLGVFVGEREMPV